MLIPLRDVYLGLISCLGGSPLQRWLPPQIDLSIDGISGAARHYDALVNGLAAVVWQMDAERLRLTFTSRNMEAVFGHPYERWVQGRDFWVKRLHRSLDAYVPNVEHDH